MASITIKHLLYYTATEKWPKNTFWRSASSQHVESSVGRMEKDLDRWRHPPSRRKLHPRRQRDMVLCNVFVSDNRGFDEFRSWQWLVLGAKRNLFAWIWSNNIKYIVFRGQKWSTCTMQATSKSSFRNDLLQLGRLKQTTVVADWGPPVGRNRNMWPQRLVLLICAIFHPADSIAGTVSTSSQAGPLLWRGRWHCFPRLKPTQVCFNGDTPTIAFSIRKMMNRGIWGFQIWDNADSPRLADSDDDWASCEMAMMKSLWGWWAFEGSIPWLQSVTSSYLHVFLHGYSCFTISLVFPFSLNFDEFKISVGTATPIEEMNAR